MKIFLTGATGFIGQHLVSRLLAENFQVTVLVRDDKSAEKLSKLGVTTVTGDVTFPNRFLEKLNNSDVLIHLAAFRAKTGRPSQVFEVNTNAFKNLITPNTKLRHVIVASSVYVFGKLKKIPAAETHPLGAKDTYGVSKIRLEEVVKDISKKFKIPYTIFRPAIVYGPGDSFTGFVMKLIKLVQKKMFPIIGDGKNLIHLVYVTDLVEAIISIVKKGGRNQIYIIAGSSPIKISEFIKLITQELGTKPKIIHLPKKPLLNLISIFEAGVKIAGKLFPVFNNEPPITVRSLENLCHNWSYDTKKAEIDLEFHPKVDYPRGVSETVKWFKSLKDKLQ